MGNNSAKEALNTVVPIFQVQEVYPPGPLLLDPEDEHIRMQLATIAAARLSPHLQVQCFVSLFKIEAYGYNFETNGFTDLPYLGRLTRRDLEVIHILDKALQHQILIAGMILNSEPTVQQLNNCRPIPRCQNAQDTIKALMEFRKKYQENLPPQVLHTTTYTTQPVPPPASYPYTTVPPPNVVPFQAPITNSQPVNHPYPSGLQSYYDTPANQPYGPPPVMNQSYYDVPSPAHVYTQAPAPMAKHAYPTYPEKNTATQVSEGRYPAYQPVVVTPLQPSVVFQPAPVTSPNYGTDTPVFTPPKQEQQIEENLKEPEQKVTEPPKPQIPEVPQETAAESGNWLQKLFSPKKEEPAPVSPVELEPIKPEPKNIFQETFGDDYESSGEEVQPEVQVRNVLMPTSLPQHRHILTFSDEEAISSLCDLGYERDDAEKAYLLSDRDEMAAMHWLADH